MEELKPCPFCGGEATLLEIPPHKHIIVDLPDYSGGAFVECTKCTAAISGETVEEAIEIWNRRAKKICPTCGSTESYGRKVCVWCATEMEG